MLSKQKLLSFSGVLAFILNVVSIIYGMVYIIAPGSAPLVNLFGVLFLLALTTNLILVYLNDLWGAKGKLSLYGTIYMVVFIVAILIMWGGGAAASSVYERTSTFMLFYLTVYPAYLIPLVIGAIQARLTLSSFNDSFPANKKRLLISEADDLKRGKKVLLVFLFLFLLPGLFFVYILLSDFYLGLTQMLVSQYSLFWAFFYFSLAILILKVHKKSPNPFRYLAGSAGFAMFIIFLMPLFLTPGAATKASADFADVFGENWQDNIPSYYEEHFTPRTFSLPGYFLGTPPGEYNYKKDILYYEGTEGIDEGISLHFDVYMPPENHEDLPGTGSTIIRIHGGAWIAGGKGVSNMMQMNKHFASQGYTVFDIQYGLTDVIDLLALNELYDFIGFINNIEMPEFVGSLTALGAPDNVVASFTLDDMIRHLGLFTRYLEEHAHEYGANLDSVFISGGSAGGHLTTAMALAIASGDYQDIFSSEIEIKGYIPFYPGNKVHEILEAIGGAEEWQDVEMLVQEDSPPSLIFQGENDGMVQPETSRSFQNRYLEEGNNSCAVIYLPMAAHASDFHFSGYHNQLFLYYMDRFLAMHK